MAELFALKGYDQAMTGLTFKMVSVTSKIVSAVVYQAVMSTHWR